MNGHRSGQLVQGPTGPGESLLGRRRQRQQEQQERQNQKMMMRRPESSVSVPTNSSSTSVKSSSHTNSGGGLTTSTSSHNYIQRLSVQLPTKRTADLTPEHHLHQLPNNRNSQPQHGTEDILRLVIHVEEEEMSANEKPRSRSDATPSPYPIRRKVSWSEESRPNRLISRRMLKQIGRQRSASLETYSSTGHRAIRIDDDDSMVTTNLSEKLIPTQNSAGSSGHIVVKEFRRSSELLRNILLSLSSRRSSDTSSANSHRTEYSNPHLSGWQSHVVSPVSGTVPGSTVEAPDLQAALQSHRKRRWHVNPAEASPITEPNKCVGIDSSSSPSAGASKLFEAIASGNLKRTRQLLESGVDPNVCNDYGYTVLHWCTVQTPVPWSSILELLEHGCRVEQRDKDGTQPVFLIPNLPKIQQQLVNDAVDYLRKNFTGESFQTKTEDDGCSAGGIDGSGGGLIGSGAGCQTGSGGGAHAGQRAAGYILRRLQQSANTKKQAQQHPQLVKNKSKDQEFLSECDTSRTFEITSIKVSLNFNSTLFAFMTHESIEKFIFQLAELGQSADGSERLCGAAALHSSSGGASGSCSESTSKSGK